MDKFIIDGGNILEGEINISGAKNSVLPIMAASILNNGTTVLRNVPLVHDVITMKQILEYIGAKVEIDGNTLNINTENINKTEAPYELVKKMRSSYYVLGSLIGRFGKASVSLPGGCVIGARPVDLHIKGLKALGADIELEHGYIKSRFSKLKGTKIFLEGMHGPSVGATINVMMAASAANGESVISGAACEPEVIDVANFINSMGGDIRGAGTHTIEINGKTTFHDTEYRIIPDRIEAGTYIIAGVLAAKELLIKNTIPSHLESLLVKLNEIGLNPIVDHNNILVKRKETFKSTNIKVLPYPGFPTDMQAQFAVLMTQAEGKSIISETIFENRFMYVPELLRMGADIQIEDNNAFVNGPTVLEGAEVMASDLRASAALILAALIAKGKTTISRIYHIDRGYERIEKKLSNVGASIKRVNPNQEE
ncbi:UDP-N-acetylglucosamine 1-carboxyvinyltransferase [candidate division WOR-3 bacterium]|nr:UDP-N-acetylglucosamine 1-carboxyvinyltransferase [candidate division WOR-3 bacterium]